MQKRESGGEREAKLTSIWSDSLRFGLLHFFLRDHSSKTAVDHWLPSLIHLTHAALSKSLKVEAPGCFLRAGEVLASQANLPVSDPSLASLFALTYPIASFWPMRSSVWVLRRYLETWESRLNESLADWKALHPVAEIGDEHTLLEPPCSISRTKCCAASLANLREIPHQFIQWDRTCFDIKSFVVWARK